MSEAGQAACAQAEAGPGWRALPYGETAVLLEAATLAEVLALYAALIASVADGVVDIVPAARTVLVTFDPERTTADRVRQWTSEGARRAADSNEPGVAGTAGSTSMQEPSAPEVIINVRYDGEDLSAVAAQLGITAAEVIERHTSSVWTAAFTGFAPGFAYLVTEHNQLQVPRHARPRIQVPAGSVGLAGEFSGIYPRASPGGWQLIGSTQTQLWDSTAEQPCLLTPATRVRFVAVDR